MLWHLSDLEHPLALGLAFVLLHAGLQAIVYVWLRRRTEGIHPEYLIQPDILLLKYLALGAKARRLVMTLTIGASLLSLFLGLFFVTVYATLKR